MENQSKITKLIQCLLINLLLLVILYNLKIDDISKIDLCIFKNITGKECFNCGMTRAFLSILHFKFYDAVLYNKNVVIVFPLTLLVYINSWIKYIFKNNNINLSNIKKV